jgi:hypothetical protein
MGVKQIVSLLLDKSHQSGHRSKIESPSHGQFVNRRAAAEPGFGKPAWLDARKSDTKPKLRQSPGQQILDSFRTGVVLSIDHVQDMAHTSLNTGGSMKVLEDWEV